MSACKCQLLLERHLVHKRLEVDLFAAAFFINNKYNYIASLIYEVIINARDAWKWHFMRIVIRCVIMSTTARIPVSVQ